MQDARLPIEVCERIMDMTLRNRTHWSTPRRHYKYDWITPLACALVCFAWLPRARTILYHMVRLRSYNGALRLACTISQRPYLGTLVQILVIMPCYGDANVSYIPFAHGFLTRHLPNVHSLRFNFEQSSMEPYSAIYSPKYHLLAARYQVHELALLATHPMERGNWAWVLRLIWSLRTLRHLILQTVGYPPTVNEEELQRVNAGRRQWSLAQLHTLSLIVSVSWYYADQKQMITEQKHLADPLLECIL